MNRFRPNIVVDGEQAPWAEDQWGHQNMQVKLREGGAVDLELCKPCSRCTVSRCITQHCHSGKFELHQLESQFPVTIREHDIVKHVLECKVHSEVIGMFCCCAQTFDSTA